MDEEEEHGTEADAGACRDYDEFFRRMRYTVPEGVLDENGWMEFYKGQD